MTDFHERCMDRAIALAARGRSRVMPNPKVGAVIAKEDRIIGEGFHGRHGGPHAEIEALRACSESPEGGTIYVTLEPCSAHGKTPPCTEAILEAGLDAVIYAVDDPNPKMAGGSARLREAGLRVQSGIGTEKARRLLAPFLKHVATGLPYVTAKWAMSLDGRIATRSGDAKWITSKEARRHGHRLRDDVGAILVGIETVRADDPRLTCRLEGGRNPLRIVFDSTGRCPSGSRLLESTVDADVLIATTDRIRDRDRQRLEATGARVESFPATESGHVNPIACLRHIAETDGINHVLVEGGATLLGTFRDRDLIDEVCVYLAPKIIGGEGAPGPVAGQGPEQLADALDLLDPVFEDLDGNWVFRGQVRKW